MAARFATEAEKRKIVLALKQANSDKGRAADILQINFKALARSCGSTADCEWLRRAQADPSSRRLDLLLGDVGQLDGLAAIRWRR